ncbi:MAG: hypothetical protein QY309_11710 [Cyclobacteriaceae bacterium]|nr:MAG: hypothetical protein QY309_11710 [Cyclobacteriaceae bacterium]
MNLTKILAYVLFVVSLALAYYLYNSINSTIKFRENISSTESQIIEKLNVIREAQKVYLEQHGRYTSSWDTLINFIETGVVPITVKSETIIPLSYGVDSIIVNIDTIAEVSAKEKIFRKTYSVNAADNGVFLGFAKNVGDYVAKGTKSYKMQKDNFDRVDEYAFLDKGTISSQADVKVGDRVTKGQNLITFWDYQLNPNVDIKSLSIVPGSGKTFDLYTAAIDRNGIKVWVIEVKDPAPINPARREENEAKNRRPLRFGSKTDVTTAGNWE